MNSKIAELFEAAKALFPNEGTEEAPKIQTVIKYAQKRADEFDEMVQYINKVDNDNGLMSGFKKSQACWQAQGYLEYLTDEAVKISLSLHSDYDNKSDEIYDALSEVTHKFEQANDAFIEFLLRHDKGFTHEGVSTLQIDILRNTAKCYEPDRRPLAAVIPIRPGLNFE